MNNHQHVKSFNPDADGKNRIKFVSAKQRAKQASADVYRSYKRRTGVVTSAASREERVHHRDQFNDSSKKRKKRKIISDASGEKKVVITDKDFFSDDDEEQLMELDVNSTFQMELDLARDRNASTLFSKCYYELSPLVGSLPEILHHAEKIVHILMSYVLSLHDAPKDPSPEEIWKASSSKKKRELFVVNIATTDVLHLLSVLARDLRHEIHPYVHTYILPRIVNDLINPPSPTNEDGSKKSLALDVTVVETAFRTLSYIFRYDASSFLNEKTESMEDTDDKSEGCLEMMRKYYGSVLTHKSEFVRRLGAESFAPLVRKLKSNTSKKKHIRRVVRSLATSSANVVQFKVSDQSDILSKCFEPNLEHNSIIEKSRENALDGVALLLFYVVRGVPGKLHSKSKAVLKILLSNLIPSEKEAGIKMTDIECFKRKVVFDLVSLVMYKIRGQIMDGKNFEAPWDLMFGQLRSSMESSKSGKSGFQASFGHIVDIVTECVSHREGALLKSDVFPQLSELNSQKMTSLLEEMLQPDFYRQLPPVNQTKVLRLFCASWRAFSEHISFGRRMRDFISTISKGEDMVVDPILAMSRELLPFLSEDQASQYLAPKILEAVADKVHSDLHDNLLVTLHAVATSRLVQTTDVFSEKDDSDDLFSTDLAHKCYLPKHTKTTLIDECLKEFDISKARTDKNILVHLGYTARIVPFLVLLRSDGSDKENNDLAEKIMKKIKKVLEKIWKSNIDKVFERDLIVASSLLIEASVFTISDSIAQGNEKGSILKTVQQISELAKNMLSKFPQSVLAVKASAELAVLMKKAELAFSLESNKLLDILAPNLKTSNHFLRLHTLRILVTLPQLPYVTDFDELDLDEDLDEQDFQKPKSQKSSPVVGSLSGMCDILETMLLIETTEINLNNERRLTTAVNRIEVLGRSGKLPALYSEAAANHMFGLLYVKFLPLWTTAVRAISALVTGHEVSVWPTIANQLDLVMSPSYFEHDNESNNDQEASDDEDIGGEMEKEHSLITRWDESLGEDSAFFAEQLRRAKSAGRVSRHQSTDRMTVFENVWKVLESVPQITTKKSRVVVPIFLEFLHGQYYLFHDDDPDARELRMSTLSIQADTESNCVEHWSKDLLDQRQLQKKLVAFLKMFGKVKGMQQLYKHKFLLVIFQSFLSNPDTVISNIALDCIIGFKLPHVIPYINSLRGMLSKSQMREVLTKFDLSIENGSVEIEHRSDLFPIIIRILFGRLSARGGGGKSSKDSPAVRRAAILSFMSGFKAENNELDYFVYMMVRNFIPSDTDMNISETGHGNIVHFRDMIQAVKSDVFASVPNQRQEGFLNLLSDVIKKLGFSVSNFIPTFVELILGILGNIEAPREDEKVDDVSDEEPKDVFGSSRNGKLRSLCFSRLSELLSQFAGHIDFSQFSETLWAVTSRALDTLPSSTINASNAPSLLVLLVTMSAHDSLLPILAVNDKAIVQVFKCLSESSRSNVVDAALKFIDNLLSEGGVYESNDGMVESAGTDRIGVELVTKHVSLLIAQFTQRLKCSDGDATTTRNLASRELNILCRVTLLLADESSLDQDKKETLATLCSLLLPYLSFEQRLNEDTQLDVLQILISIIPRLDPEKAKSHVQTFSRLLGPNRSSAGIKSIVLRQEIVKCLGTIGRITKSASLSSAVSAMDSLNAPNPKHVDEWDFERVLPVLNALGSESSNTGSWKSFVENDNLAESIKSLMPLLYCCFNLLHDEDGVLSRGAFKALSTLVSTASAEGNAEWVRLISTTFMACLRVGLKCHNVASRKNFILLISAVTKEFVEKRDPALCSDLDILRSEDAPELDFFLNITHVQVHRRVRALGRLRKRLLDCDQIDDCPITVQSLIHILLPIALHPIYECDKKDEEAYVMEAVSCIGAITRLLPWGKYQNVLWTALTQISRHQSREANIINLICSILDSFHFVVEEPVFSENGQIDENSKVSFIWRQLNGKLIPTIDGLLMKDIVDRNGTKNKSLRAPIALALVKLLRKLPNEMFKSKFPRLVTVICQALRNRDSDERDVARKTMSKIVLEVETTYLIDIFQEMAITLNEGYKLHVRTATLHSILLSLSKAEGVFPSKSFDNCVPSIVDILQQDIFGTASEMKEAEATKKRLVKEAGGSKGLGCIEFVSRMIDFSPSKFVDGSSNSSSIHTLVNPFLSRLQDPEVPSSVIRKVKEVLKKIILGLSQNLSVASEEMLPFVYATISPFLILDSRVKEENEEDIDDSDEEEEKKLEVSKSGRSKRKKEDDKKKAVRKVFNWTPSQLKSAKDSSDAYEMKVNAQKEMRKVLDGESAPKLTGVSRYDSLKSKTKDLNSPATACALSFGLGLLHSHLKKNKANINVAMSDPFVRILFQCVKYSKHDNAVLLSLKSLQVMLRLDLPSIPTYRKELAKCILKILSTLSCNTQNEMVQGGFKTLTLLLVLDRFQAIAYLDNVEQVPNKVANNNGEKSTDNNEEQILDKGQMHVLLSILRSALTDAEHHNSTFGVIKAITASKYVSPEFYDLMEEILKMTVQSQKRTMRQQAARIFMQYLIEYPMGKTKLENHLKQLVLNVKYQYEDGRMSALELVHGVIHKLPLPLLEEYTQLFFLPLVLQLANDESNQCREKVGEIIKLHFSRLSTSVLQSLYDYAERWAKDTSGGQLQRIAIQLYGLFVESRLDFMKRGKKMDSLVIYAKEVLNSAIGDIDHTSVLEAGDWEIIYFCLHAIEKVGDASKSLLWNETDLWKSTIACLAHAHPWVQLISSRILHTHFSSCTGKQFEKASNKSAASSLVKEAGLLFEIVRNLCFEINSEEEHQSEKITTMAIKNLLWIVKLMESHPHLFLNDRELEEDLSGDEDNEEMIVSKNPLTWLITRLSNIAKKRGVSRRKAVFKAFAAIASVSDDKLLENHLELMIEPLNRVIVETEARDEHVAVSRKHISSNFSSESEADLPREVLELLEDKVGTDKFINALSSVKSKAREKRESRKQAIAREAIYDPEKAAKRKISKQQKEKSRKKRRIQEKKKGRGVFTSKPRL